MKLEVWRHRYYRDEKTGLAGGRWNSGSVPRGTALAGGHFREWSGPPAGFLEEFFEEADGLSQADHDTADIIQRVSGRIPFAVRLRHGGSFRSSCYQSHDALPGHLGAHRWPYREGVCDTRLMLILKAFPLEFEGDNRTQRQRFLRRARAMSRYYQSRLGVRVVPGPYGVDGWMWRPLRYCPEPPTRAPRRPRRALRSHFRIP